MTQPQDRTAARPRFHWPFGILAVAALRIVDATILAAIGLGAGDLVIGGLPVIGADTPLTRTLDVTMAVLTLLGIVGLLLFKRWGWVLTMVLVGLSLLGDLIRVAIGDPTYLSLLLHVMTALYLNGRSVRALASDRLAVDEQVNDVTAHR